MIYLHVPFCRSFCIYCGFYSELAGKSQSGSPVPFGGRKVRCPGREQERMEAYAEEVIAEIGRRKEEIRLSADSSIVGDSADTLYIGGGTPSVLSEEHFFRILDAIDEVFPAGHRFREFTLEVNPEDIVERKEPYVRALLARGVNRVSMGVQSFDDGLLRWMNRRHNAEKAQEAYHILRKAGVPNISIDLIFGIPGIDSRTWHDTLEQAISLYPEHISSYQLSIDDNSVLGRLSEEGRFQEAPDEECRSQYDYLCHRLADAGYHHYEISNFSLPGKEAIHNSAYWRRVPYVGLGPGAHSLVNGRLRTANTEEVPWKVVTDCLTEEDVKVETIMLGLRTDIGVKKSYLYAHADKHVVESYLKSGCLVSVGDHVRIPESEFFVSDDIICGLI